MTLATVFSRAQNGLAADLVTIEVHLGPGLPGFNIVGLPEAAVREARDRVKSAIVNTGYDFPTRKITCNLAPADLPKDGARFDLAIALGILAASRQLPLPPLAELEVLGELSLSGAVRPVRGALPAALKSSACGRGLLLPSANAAEAGLAPEARIHVAEHLGTLCSALHAGPLDSVDVPPRAAAALPYPDLSDVRGQTQARRALEIAAAGGHSLLFVGPPGSGKSMLAQRLPGILPPMTDAEALESAAVASISETGFDAANWGRRPFRSPHHTASGVALVGGGSVPRPGEITLAHQGVLFLDELPEFDRRVLEVLREPLESGHITVSRAARQADFPARFQLIAAMNPCPCGHLGDPEAHCRCTPDQVARYRGRLSGPLLDRIDLQVFVPRVERAVLLQATVRGERSDRVRERGVAARERQLARSGCSNARLDVATLAEAVVLDDAARALMQAASTRLGLSARAIHRVLRVARTVADLRAAETVSTDDLAQAIGYRTQLQAG